jgi:O-antigen ligase
MTKGALVVGIATLIIFIPSQLGLEGTLTARPREVNLVLLFCALGLVSVAFAKESRLEGWNTFSSIFIRAVVMFIVIVNVVRTEKRLRGLILVLLGSACYLSIIALNDYRLGLLTVEGYRVKGAIGGVFDNSNDLAIHLVTMFPLAIALLLASRSFIKKAIFAACALLLLAATTVTFSRGGFLALLAAVLALAWTLGKKNRVLVTVALCILALGFLAFAPGGYGLRILSIFDRSLDAHGSGESRQALLMQSIKVAIRNPLFGIGMGNFPFVSFHDKVSHNSYTQVAAEMGFAALITYLAFQITPLKRLRRIIRETVENRRGSLSYYLAVGLFASLVAFMVASFFGSVAYYWNVYYLVGCAAALWRVYKATHTPEATASEKTAQGTTATGRVEQVAPLPAR